MKIRIILIVLVCVLLSGCSEESTTKEVLGETSTPQKTNATPTPEKSDETPTPDQTEPTPTSSTNKAKEIKQLLPLGEVEGTIMKWEYVYKSKEDEEREKELEAKLRAGIEANWEELNKDDFFETIYHKDVQFRDSLAPVFEMSTYRPEMGLSEEEYNEFLVLYYGVKSQFVEKEKVTLTIDAVDENKIRIDTKGGLQYIQDIVIDFSKETLTKEDNTLKWIDPTKVQGENIWEALGLWYLLRKDVKKDESFTIYKYEEQKNGLLLNYSLLDYNKHSVGREFVFIKSPNT